MSTSRLFDRRSPVARLGQDHQPRRLAEPTRWRRWGVLAAGVALVGLAQPVFAAVQGHADGHGMTTTLLWIAVLLIAAKLAGLVERFGQPAVLGELVIGVILGNLVLVGIDAFDPVGADPILGFLAELGVIILLFQIGLESNLAQLGARGVRSRPPRGHRGSAAR